MDPLTNASLWLYRNLEAEIKYWAVVLPLRAERAWIELQLIWIDIKLALRS